MCNENKEKEKTITHLFFVGRKEFQKQPTKCIYTEINEVWLRDSILNKGTNSLLISEYLNNDDLSALGTQMGTRKIAMAGTQHCQHWFIPLLVYGFFIIKCTGSVIN